MKDLDPMVLLAVFQEMLGPVMWMLLAVVVLGVLMFAFVVFRDREINSQRLLQSEVLGLIGGAGALVFMAYVTHSGFTDAGGPIDWLLIGVIFGVGAIGTTLLAYAVLGCWQRCGPDSEMSS